MSKKPKQKKLDLEKFRASADRRAEEGRRLWAALYSEPIVVDEESMARAEAVGIPDDVAAFIQAASEKLKEKVRRDIDKFYAEHGEDPRLSEMETPPPPEVEKLVELLLDESDSAPPPHTPEELASLNRKMDLITLGYDPTLTDPFEGQSPEEARARYLLQSRGLLSDMAKVAGIDLSKHPDWDALDKALEGEFPKDSIPD